MIPGRDLLQTRHPSRRGQITMPAVSLPIASLRCLSFCCSSLHMGVTVWWLRDPAGIDTRCALRPGENDSCELTLEQANQVILAEHHPDLDAALRRANAMWIECQLDGWTEL